MTTYLEHKTEKINIIFKKLSGGRISRLRFCGSGHGGQLRPLLRVGHPLRRR